MFDDNQIDFNEILNEILNKNVTIWTMNISKEKKFYKAAWSKFDKNSCISIDYVIDKVDIDYSSFKSKEEIKEYLNDDESIQPDLIYQFIHEIKNGDLFIAHKGESTLTAIGIVKSNYIHHDGDLKNIRKVNWLYIGDLFVKKSFFDTSNIINRYSSTHEINEIICIFARVNENIHNNLLESVYSKFYEYYTQTDRKDKYDLERQHIRKEWSKIKEKYDNGDDENASDLMQKKIFGRKLKLFNTGTPTIIKNWDKTAKHFFKTINNLVKTSDVDEQRKS